MFLLRAVLNMLVRNASPRGPMCFRCLIFNLSGPCKDEVLVVTFLPSCTVERLLYFRIMDECCSTLPIVQLLHRFYMWRCIPIWCCGC